jgi:hypothetical protein
MISPCLKLAVFLHEVVDLGRVDSQQVDDARV